MSRVKYFMIIFCFSVIGMLIFDFTSHIILGLKNGPKYFLIYFFIYYLIYFTLIKFVVRSKMETRLVLTAIAAFIGFFVYQNFIRLPGDWVFALKRSSITTIVSCIPFFYEFLKRYKHRKKLNSDVNEHDDL